MVAAEAAAAVLLSGALPAQEPRPLELHSWLAPHLAMPRLALAGDLTSCTLVRCNQTASFFASTKTWFDVGLTTGVRLNDLGTTQIGGRSALGSVYLDYSVGPLSLWSGGTTGHGRSGEAVTPDPAPGLESGLSFRWRRVGVALSAAEGWLVAPAIGNHVSRASPIIRITNDSLGLRADTTYPPTGDSTGTSSNRWSSTEARITWRQERWWITARAGRLASTRQSTALWAGLQAGAELSRGVSLLLGAGKSAGSLTATGDRSAAPHVSLGFGFNTAVLSHRETGRDSAEATSATARPFVISDLGAGRYRMAVRIGSAQSVEVACDCNGWTPTQMTRAGGAWIAELRTTPGVHHMSIRINGAGWIAPPGLTPIDDDFAGQAGLVIVP
jgi:hypothetical protein